jgi:membrane peptidoglycan carboxypeptidase
MAVNWMRTHDRGLFTNAASLLVCGVLAGVVVAAAAFPALAMGGLAAKAGADQFGELPSQLKVLPSPQISYVYASDNKTLLATIYDENRHDIKITDVPTVMQNAIIAAEDSRFYEHHGVDLQGLIRAFVSNQTGGANTQGASTLTMQYVRQAITYSATSPQAVIEATEQTNTRKLREIKYALTLETQLTKDQILERYLNIAAFGHGAYGIYAASEVYFGKEPKDLKLEEAALLAGLVKAPSDFDPTTAKGRPQALLRRTYVLRQMFNNNMISAAERDAADQAPLKVTGQRTPNGCVATPVNQWGFFCDYLYRWWLQQDAFGEDASTREAKLKAGGYRIVASMDVRIQKSAQKNVETGLKTGNSDALMVAAIEPGTGRIKAMAVNRRYGLDTSHNGLSTDPAKRAQGIKGTYPTTTNPLLSGGGDISGYKAGSTFKMFTMLAALEHGYPLDFTIHAVSPYQSKYIVGTTDPSACGDHIHWCPRNASSKMNGIRNMWTGYGGSVNTYFVPLEEKVGADNVVGMAKRLGMHFRNSNDLLYTSPEHAFGFGPFTIGVTDTVPLELADAYATVAADGKYCEPIPVVKIFQRDGTPLDSVTAPRCRQAVAPDIAHAALDAARCPIQDRGGLGRCNGANTTGVSYDGRTIRDLVGHPLFGKTGTSDNNWTANLVISTKQLTIAGTMADPDHAEASHQMDPHMTNLVVARTMRDAMKGRPSIQFATPPNTLAFGKRAFVPNVICRTVNEARARLQSAGFDVAINPRQIDSACPKDTVAATDPSGSTSRGATVDLILSNGKAPGGPGPGGGPSPTPTPPGHGRRVLTLAVVAYRRLT